MLLLLLHIISAIVAVRAAATGLQLFPAAYGVGVLQEVDEAQASPISGQWGDLESISGLSHPSRFESLSGRGQARMQHFCA